MKILGGVQKVFGVYDKQKSVNKTKSTSSVASKSDVVSISNQAKDFQTALKAVKEIPDIREEKVQELVERYESGNYSVDGKKITEKLFSSLTDYKA